MKHSKAHYFEKAGRRISRLVKLLFSILFGLSAIAASGEDDNGYGENETSVFLNVQGVGSTEIPAIVLGETALLPIVNVFNFLKIRNISSPGMDTVSGFFINSDAIFLISKTNNTITHGGVIYNLRPEDLIKTETNLFLNAEFFGKIFGLNMTFSFRTLSIALNTKLELPVVREMRQDLIRKNIEKLKGEVSADTTVTQRYPLFSFGAADWAVTGIEQLGGRNQALLGLSLGAIVAGGETNISLNYNTDAPFNGRNQYYLWRYVNNENRALRQILVGKILPQSIATIFSPVAGIQLTNTPTHYRRSFGEYTISNTTQPGWIVELYLNNVLVNYTKADAAGFYSFKVPLVYGSSQIKLRFYGPWGEEQSKVENINIPFNFLPSGTMEYNFSAGIVQDGERSRFSRGNINYGLTKRVTLGGGVEYLSSISSGKVLPFVTSSMRLAKGLLFSGEYTYAVRTKEILNYRLPGDFLVELNYTKYESGQKAINFGFLEERKAIVSMPLRYKRTAVFSRFTLNQVILPIGSYVTSEWLISGSIGRVGTNITTYGLFRRDEGPYLYNNVALTFRLPKGILFTPQLQYQLTDNALISWKCTIEKNIFTNIFVNAFYEKNYKSNFRTLGIDLRYDLPFAQSGVSARDLNGRTTLVQNARGSVRVDSRTEYVGFSNRTSVGRGGIVIVPFVDINGNGIKDEDEPKAYGLKLHTNGGTVETGKDSCIRIFDLEPYIGYLLEFDPNGFDNIGWQLRKRTMNVIAEPNHFKLIALPVDVVAEVSGTVLISGKTGTRGQGQIIVSFCREDNLTVTKTLSEEDGFFSYLGLRPGNYAVRIDSAQLAVLNMKALPSVYSLTISQNSEGDVIDDLVFTLQSLKADSFKAMPDAFSNGPADNVYPAIQKPKDYSIQVSASKNKGLAMQLSRNLERSFRRPVIVIYSGGFYKVRIAGFASRKAAIKFRPRLDRKGFVHTIVVKHK